MKEYCCRLICPETGAAFLPSHDLDLPSEQAAYCSLQNPGAVHLFRCVRGNFPAASVLKADHGLLQCELLLSGEDACHDIRCDHFFGYGHVLGRCRIVRKRICTDRSQASQPENLRIRQNSLELHIFTEKGVADDVIRNEYM